MKITISKNPHVADRCSKDDHTNLLHPVYSYVTLMLLHQKVGFISPSIEYRPP